MGARPKEGLDYFSVDTDMFEDHKILLAQELIDPDGTSPIKRLLVPYIAIRLLREIYKCGYHMEWNNLQCLTISAKIGHGVTLGSLNDFTNCLIESGFFNKDIYEKFHVLTSKGIQKRWYYVAKNLNRKNFSITQPLRLYTFEKSIPMEFSRFPREEIEKSTEEWGHNGQEMPTTSLSFSFSNTIDTNSSIKDNESRKKKKEKKTPEEIEKTPEEIEKTPEEIEKTPEEIEKTPEEIEKTPEEIEKTPEEIQLDRVDLQVLAKTSDDFKEAWKLWINYQFYEHGKTMKSIPAKTIAVEELIKLAGYNEKEAINIIKKSIANKWKGFHEPKKADSQHFARRNGSGESKIESIPKPGPDDPPDAWKKWHLSKHS